MTIYTDRVENFKFVSLIDNEFENELQDGKRIIILYTWD